MVGNKMKIPGNGGDYITGKEKPDIKPHIT